MKNVLLTCLLLLGLSPALAQETNDAKQLARARAAIEDLQRIAAPSGIQESYKTSIGGIDQWLNVRGQDRSNPIILFVHGGPAAPITPTMWEFQRPIEEYFTVVHWDQRGAGKDLAGKRPGQGSADDPHRTLCRRRHRGGRARAQSATASAS